jgi:asparagine synthase (glutamine-hydrolysing)
MCGFAGVAFAERDMSSDLQFKELSKRIAHRGPDGSGITSTISEDSKLHFSFAHHRLAIVETSPKSNQPLVSKRGSILVYNGEIYNLDELRRLIGTPNETDINSDSQVLLSLLEEHGLDILKKINGMFAFAFKHHSTDQVWLGRDRLGVKPLYYSLEAGVLWFGSEAKPLGEILNRKLDEIAIHEWVRYQLQVSNRTFFEGIYSVNPGTFVVFSPTGRREVRYWSIDNHLPSNSYSDIRTPEECATSFEHIFDAAVRDHLVSDVPISSIISGGMDSSSVAATAALHELKTSFVGRYPYDGFDETDFAKRVALQSGCNLTIVDITEEDFGSNIEQLISSIDLPAAGPGAIGQYLVSKKISDSGFKVVLSGTGGDELFLGYTRNRFPLIASSLMKQTQDTNENYWGSISGNLGSLAGYSKMYKRFVEAGGFSNPLEGFLATIRRNHDQTVWTPDQDLLNKIDSELAGAISPNGGSTTKEIHDSLLRFEVGFFLPSLLQIEDRTSMAHGLEARVPFLDLRLIEFMLALPLEARLLNGRPKELLRGAMRHRLPAEVLSRRDKMGFPLPLGKMSRGKVAGDINMAIAEIEKYDLNFINPRIYRDGISGIRDERTIWALISLAYWLKSLRYLGGNA